MDTGDPDITTEYWPRRLSQIKSHAHTEGNFEMITRDEFDRPIIDTAAAVAEYVEALTHSCDAWVIANCGMDVPSRNEFGRWQVRVWNPCTLQHGYLDLDIDVVTVD